MSNLRAAILTILFLEILYKEEAANKNNKSILRLGGNAISDERKLESFLNIKWFFEWNKILLLD